MKIVKSSMDWAGYQAAIKERWVNTEELWTMRCTKHNTVFNTTVPLDDSEPEPEPCWDCVKEFTKRETTSL